MPNTTLKPQSAQSAVGESLANQDFRRLFPGLQREVNGKALIYLDSANTAQKIEAAIVASENYYRNGSANVFRAVHTLSEEATVAFESAREQVRALLNAPDVSEVIFTRGTTEAFNLLAQSYGSLLKAGDVIVLSEMEHHANLVPWQLLAQRSGVELRFVPVNSDGKLELEALDELLDGRVKVLSLTHVSNVLGSINPIAQICAKARAMGIVTMIDGSQAVPHLAVDVQALGCDFYAFTGHKLFAPTGTGALWGRRELLERMPPFLAGGEMIERVTLQGCTFAKIPNKFEAGTPNIAGIIGLGAAVAELRRLGFSALHAYERQLGEYALRALTNIPGLTLHGRAVQRAPVFSFNVEGVHPHDLATLLDQEGIAIRSGQHCAHPLMQKMGVSASARASLAFYNTFAEIDALILGIAKARKILGA